jgi:hypothetical protein
LIFSNPAFIRWRACNPVIEHGVKWSKMPPWVLWSMVSFTLTKIRRD